MDAGEIMLLTPFPPPDEMESVRRSLEDEPAEAREEAAPAGFPCLARASAPALALACLLLMTEADRERSATPLPPLPLAPVDAKSRLRAWCERSPTCDGGSKV